MVRRPALTQFAARQQEHRSQDQSTAQQSDRLEDFPEEQRGQQYRYDRLEGGKHRSVRWTNEFEPCQKGYDRDDRGDECHRRNRQPARAGDRPMRAADGGQDAEDEACRRQK